MATAQSIKEEISKHRDEIYKKDYTFYQIDTLAKCAVKVEAEAENCPLCAEMLTDMEKLASEYPQLLNSGSVGRASYEKRLNVYVDHLRQKHGYVREGFYMPVCIAVGLAVGFVAGWLSGYYVPCMAVAMVIGYIVGTAKDRHVRKKGKVL